MADDISVSGRACRIRRRRGGRLDARRVHRKLVGPKPASSMPIWPSSPVLGYDASLETGPYNFGFLDDPALGNYVEHFPYQDGLLINYWDTSQTERDNISDCRRRAESAD